MSILKRHGFKIGFIALMAIPLGWFVMAPASFKSTWARVPFIAEIIREHNLVIEKAKVMTISYYFPHFPYFAQIVEGAQKPNEELMDGYHFGKPYIFHMYYQKAAELFPKNEDAYVLLGYTEYYQKSINDALRDYQKSIELNPYFFWSYYNLGVIYFQQKDYMKSVWMFTRALSLNHTMTLEILHQSGLYRQIWKHVNNPPQLLQSNLEQGRQDAGVLLAASYLKGKAFAQSLQVLDNINGPFPWHQDLKEALRIKAQKHENLEDSMEVQLINQIPVRLF